MSSNEEGKTDSNRRMTRKGLVKWLKGNLGLMAIIFTQLTIASITSLPSPFLPLISEEKGVDQLRYSLVFSVNKGVNILGCFLSECLMVRTSAHFSSVFGLILSLFGCVAYGCIYWINAGPTYFWAASLVVGGFSGLGLSFFTCGVFASVTHEFPQHCIILIGMMEVLWGLGNAIGPYVGGLLIDLWAFPLPYFVATIFAVLGIFILFGLPPSKQKALDAKHEEENDSPDQSFRKLFLDFNFLVDALTFGLGWLVVGFNDGTLQPHVNQFGLSAASTGSVFTAQYASYTVSTIAMAALSILVDKDEILLALTGIVGFIGFSVMGPLPFLPFETKLWAVYVGQVTNGFLVAGFYSVSYSHAIKNAIKRGFPDNLWMFCAISFLFFSLLNFSSLVAPIIGGSLMKNYGYRNASLFIVVTLIVWDIVLFGRFIYNKIRASEKTFHEEDFPQEINTHMQPVLNVLPKETNF